MSHVDTFLNPANLYPIEALSICLMEIFLGYSSGRMKTKSNANDRFQAKSNSLISLTLRVGLKIV